MSSTAEKRAIKRSRIYLREDVAKHNKPKDCWVIHNNKIYDVSAACGLWCPPTSCLLTHNPLPPPLAIDRPRAGVCLSRRPPGRR